MYPKKGVIAPGSDADLVLWDPGSHTISAATHHMRVDYSMFEGYKVTGNARTVLSRGELIVDNGQFHRQARTRQYLRRAARGGAWKYELQSRPHALQRRPRARPASQRTWGTYNYASLWVAMSVCIPTYMLACGLIAGGMNWRQAIGTILLGNLIVLIPMLLNAHAGAQVRHSVSGLRARVVRRARRECSGRAARAGRLRLVRHPDLDRRPGDLRDADDPLAGCGTLRRRRSGSASSPSGLLNMFVIWRGIDTIRFLEGIGAPFMLGDRTRCCCWWITRQGRRLRPDAQRRRASSRPPPISSASSSRR